MIMGLFVQMVRGSVCFLLKLKMLFGNLESCRTTYVCAKPDENLIKQKGAIK